MDKNKTILNHQSEVDLQGVINLATEAGLTKSQVARQAGFTYRYLKQMLDGDRHITSARLQQIKNAVSELAKQRAAAIEAAKLA